MERYVVYSYHLKASKTKGELPDIVYQYIANDSMIPWHYTFTENIKNAYQFDESEEAKAMEIANLWDMKVKQI